jgi:prefoldin alpha subunit
MEKQQEQFIQLQELDHKANQYGEQLKNIENEIKELSELKNNLKEIVDNQGQEIFSEIGKGIFIKSELKKENFMIEVGSKVFIPKSLEEVNKIISEQIEKLEEAKKDIEIAVEKINSELNEMINKINSKK